MDENSPPFTNNKVAQLIGKENIQSWKQQVLLSVRRYNLEDHIHGTIVILQIIQDADGNIQLNPS